MHKIETPVFIDVTFNYFCNDCMQCELEAKTERLYDMDGNVYATVHSLTCEHYQTCKTLMHNLRYMQRAERAEE